MLLGRSRIRLTLAVTLLMLVLAALAAALAHNHAAERDGARRRAADEATITASLAASVFSNNLQTTSQSLAETYGGALISQASLENTLSTGNAEYARILDAAGRPVAETAGAPGSPTTPPDFLHRVLTGTDRYRVSSFTGGATVEYAIRFPTAAGTRVFVEGFDAARVGDLLRAYLGRLPDARRQRGYVVDRQNRIIASMMSAKGLGQTADAAGPGRTVVAAPIRGTEWRVLLSQDNGQLYRGISWRLSWLALVALALAGLTAITFLIRAQRRGVALTAAYDDQRHAALHDALTGLGNRTLFHDRVEHAAARMARQDIVVAVLFLDLDRFKVINDSLGHLHGDEFLVAVGAQIVAAVRPGDTVARLGGDEFAILLEDLAGFDEAEVVASRILAGLHAPLGDKGIYASASIGIALVTAGATAEEVIRDADTAMYRAKDAGRGRYARFDTTLREAALARLEIETRLRRGNGLEVVYQPIVAIGDGRLHGFEVLARWNDEDGSMMPDAFIPVAEETGLIATIGRQVMQEACRQLAAWDAPIVLSVNIAARQLLEPGFGDEVRDTLAGHGIDPAALRLEITETAADADAVAVRAALVELFDGTGVRAHLDDFGVGTASMTVLQRFPGDALKIDRSFVASMATDPGAYEIVTSVIGLAHALGMTVVAEGIETSEQLQTLRDLGCDYYQGFLIARPLRAEDAEAWLVPGRAMGRISD